jgi:hypothetical protein
MPGPDPYSTGLAAAGALGNFFAGRSAAKASKEQMRRQNQILQRQGQLFASSQQYYPGLLQAGAQYAGLGGMPGAPNSQQQTNAYGKEWGDNSDQLRLRAAEEDIRKRQMLQAQQLRHQLGGAGVADASIGAALGRNQQQGQQQYGEFRRGLAINAGAEMDRRRQGFLGQLGTGFGMGGQAAAGFGQQGAQYGQQADQAYGGLGNILSQYMYQRTLGQQPGLGGTADTYDGPATSPTLGTPDYYKRRQNWWENPGGTYGLGG